ncbi:hypothetical protein O988_05113 [Pseudogymnoascus sp. VKM F-3808]|nr:hypothetical protein O988_05113 [Pseudogymnoascus sp. VKM F-3808]
MSAIQLSFDLRTSSTVKTVHLLGSWDNYAGQLPLAKDKNSSKSGAWKGTFKFQGSLLQSGQRYWYYYIIDGYHVSHNPVFLQVFFQVLLEVLFKVQLLLQALELQQTSILVPPRVPRPHCRHPKGSPTLHLADPVAKALLTARDKAHPRGRSPHSTTTSTPAHRPHLSARHSALAQILPAHRPFPAVSQTIPTAPSAHVNATVSHELVTGSSLTAEAPAAAIVTRTPAVPPPTTMRSHPLPDAKASSSADRQPMLRLVANSHAFPCILIGMERAARQGTFSTPRTSGPRCSSPKHSFKEKSALDRSESLTRRQSWSLTPITKPNPRQHTPIRPAQDKKIPSTTSKFKLSVQPNSTAPNEQLSLHHPPPTQTTDKMGKERVEKKEKKEKKEKRSDKDGVKKSKKDKKSTLNGDAVAKAIEEQLMETAAPAAEGLETIEEDTEFAVKPVGALVPFAAPLADDKVAKKVLKSVKKAAKNKTLKRGVKEVVKSLRKSPAGAANVTGCGVVILAADISPMDVISHIPVLCEDHNVPYIFVNSRAELGAAGNTKRPTSVVMVSEKRTGAKKEEKIDGEDEFADVYKDLVKLVEKESRSVRV